MPSAARTAAACLSDRAKADLRAAPYAYGNGYVTQAMRTIDIRLDGYVPQEVNASTSKGELLIYIGDLERALRNRCSQATAIQGMSSPTLLAG